MNSKQLWAATATILVLSTFGPRSPGVWAQDAMAACRRGWEWVRHMLAHLFASKKTGYLWLCQRSRVDCIRLQNQNSLGQDPCTISSMLDGACRGIGECAYSDHRDAPF